jgi:hypothetical protein
LRSIESWDPAFWKQPTRRLYALSWSFDVLRATSKKVGLLINFNTRFLKDGVRRYVL